MKKTLIPLLSLMLLFSCIPQKNVRSAVDFNFGWRFALSDNPQYSDPDFDDTPWRELHLPHDWSIEGSFDRNNPSTPSGGALPGGIGWYRKTFDAAPRHGTRVCLEFDGVFMNSSVYVNGSLLGTRPYGYSSFCYDITDVLRDGRNVVAVRCDNSEQPNSRWYAGCGIYRDVRLVTVPEVHVRYNGMYVTTEGSEVTARAEVCGEAESLEFVVADARGRTVASKAAETGGDGLWTARIWIPEAHLWDVADPYLYSVSGDYTLTVNLCTCTWELTK